MLNNKWMRAAVPALLIHCSIGTVYCWSSFSTDLADYIGVSSGVLGWAFSLAIFFLGMSAAFAGKLVERNIHRSSLIAALFFTAGMLGTGVCIAFTDTLGPTMTTVGIFFFYGCIMGIGLGVGYLTPVKTLMLWFSENKGLGTGISIMGFGLAKAIASPIMNSLQNTIGLANMFFVLGAVYFVMMMLGHFLLKKPDGWVEPQEEDGFHSLSMLKNRNFLCIWLMFYINITCGLALISFEKPILKLVGLSAGAISVVQSCTAATNALGRIGFSTVSDKCKDRNTIYIIIFAMSLVISIIAVASSSISGGLVALTVVLLLLINAGYGGGFSTLPALLGSRFGMKHVSQIHGLSLSAWAFAGLSGNQLSNFLYGKTGRYETVLIALCVLYAIALLLSKFGVKKECEIIE